MQHIIFFVTMYTDTHVAVGDFQAGDALEDLLHLPLRRRNSVVGRHFYVN